MSRVFPIALLCVGLTSTAQAQGPLQRAGQALDNAGRNIRRGVEGAVARGQITAQERDLLGRVQGRLLWDKQLSGSALRLVVGADGAVVLQGSVLDEPAKKRAVDLAQSTLGVTTVIDELAVAKDVKVIQTAPARVVLPQAIETEVVVPRTRVIAPGVEVVVPGGATVIEKR